MKRLSLVACLLTAFGFAAPAAALDTALADFAAHFEPRLGTVSFANGEVAGCGEALHLESDALVAPATGPLVLDHGTPTEDVVVLFHGLSDSPFFLCAVARALHADGANVVLPLLTGHGLKEPLPDAHAPELGSRWQEDARAALAFALTRGERVSVGGFSTGGTLAVWLWTQAPERIEGGVVLFSAALDFARRLKLAAGCAGTPEERAASGFRRWCHGRLVAFTRRGERDAAWRWANPYRQRLSDYGALELGILRRATRSALATTPLTAPLFIAHSVDDGLAPIVGVDRLAADHAEPDAVVRFTIDDTRRANCRALQSDCVTAAPARTACGVSHASVVLATPIRREDAVCEPANPRFEAMLAAVRGFMASLP